jgi:hypothetical protein
MNKLEVLKTLTKLVVGAGVAHIVNSIVSNLVPTETTLQKVLVFAGKAGISMTVSDLVDETVDGKIDAAAQWVSEHVVLDPTDAPMEQADPVD